MSELGAGGVVLLPAVAFGAVAGLALLAAAGTLIAGGVIVAQTGKAVVACGRYVGEAIQQHAARQRAVFELCDEYERRVRRGARESAMLTQTAGTARRARLLSRLNARRALADADPPEPPLPIPDDPGLVEETAPPAGFFVHSDLDRQAERLAAELAGVEQTLSELNRPEWTGLLVVQDLNEQLAELKQAVEHNRAATEGEPVRLARDLKRDLLALRAEVAYRAAEGRAKHAQRQQAIQALIAAGAQLEEQAQRLRAEPELEPALDLAADMLAHADELLAQGDLAGAQETAQTALHYVEQLAGSLDALRRANLEAALQALQEHVTGFGFPPDDDAPLPLNSMIAEAEAHLRENRLDACWETLQAAQGEVGRLSEHVQQRLMAAQRDAAVSLARETLAGMNYAAGPLSVDEGGWAGFKATRADGAYFRVWVTPDGLLQYKAQGFGAVECQAEAVRFFEKLKERGMHVSTQSEFNMTATKERLTEVFLRLGFTMVGEEPAPDGRSTTLVATKSDGSEHRETVGHESPPAVGGAVSERREPDADTYLERARRLQQEAHRWRMQRMQENLRRRLRN